MNAGHLWRRWFFYPEKTPDDTIGVDLELDELDITSAEAKATYPGAEGIHVTKLRLQSLQAIVDFHEQF